VEVANMEYNPDDKHSKQPKFKSVWKMPGVKGCPICAVQIENHFTFVKQQAKKLHLYDGQSWSFQQLIKALS